MKKPKEGERWTVLTERLDPETGSKLAPINLRVVVARVESGGTKKGISQETGKEYEINVPSRVHFRYDDDDRNREFEIVGLIGTYELSNFLDQASHDGG